MFQLKCAERMNTVLARGATIIFVSHNLRAVADLCSQSLLLDHGRMVAVGPTEQVVQRYLSATDGSRREVVHQEAFLSRVVMRNENGGSVEFESGRKAWVDVEGERPRAVPPAGDCAGVQGRESLRSIQYVH